MSDGPLVVADLYGYPVTAKNDPDASNDTVCLRIGSDIHKQNAFCRLEPEAVQKLHAFLGDWMEKHPT